jgi:sec-independent protein translocase protein TatA
MATIGGVPTPGPLELAIVLIIALIVFGPKRLPELGRSLGRGIREFRSSVSGKKDDDADERGFGPPEIENGTAEEAPAPEDERVAPGRD